MTGEREKGNTSIAIWCENSSSVVGPLGDLADMFRYVEDDVLLMWSGYSSLSTKKGRQHIIIMKQFY